MGEFLGSWGGFIDEGQLDSVFSREGGLRACSACRGDDALDADSVCPSEYRSLCDEEFSFESPRERLVVSKSWVSVVPGFAAT